MPSWNELVEEFTAASEKGAWLNDKTNETLRAIGDRRGGRHVIMYGSAFLQKPSVPAENLIIHGEDLNGLMSVIHGMDWTRGLVLVLHTPGGETSSTESLVDYLRSKFATIEVIVPTYAMSAGTMISLASDRIIMGRHSQLGPIDPQMGFSGRRVSAQAVVEQFERARKEVLTNTAAAHVWAPILQSLGPSLLQEAQNAIDYSERLVARWLERYMFSGRADPAAAAKVAAEHFNDAAQHKNHGRRIGRDEAREQGLEIEDLEDDQQLQEAVLTAYHLLTIMFENSMATKVIRSDLGTGWIKNWAGQQPAR